MDLLIFSAGLILLIYAIFFFGKKPEKIDQIEQIESSYDNHIEEMKHDIDQLKRDIHIEEMKHDIDQLKRDIEELKVPEKNIGMDFTKQKKKPLARGSRYVSPDSGFRAWDTKQNRDPD